MKKKLTMLLLIVLGLPLIAAAQVSKKTLEEARRIQESDKYYWGRGVAATLQEASQQALADLQQKIHVRVGTYVDVKIDQEQIGQEVSSQRTTNIGIETSSGGVLKNTQSMVLAEKPEWQVLRYVEKSEVSEEFRQRESRINEYLRDGVAAEGNGRIDNALRYYYWAYCLLRSLPNPDEPKFTDAQFHEHRLLKWIPSQIEHIFEGLKVEAGAIEDNTLNLVASYGGLPVTSLDLNYAAAENQWQMVSMKDGIAQIALPEGASSSMQMAYEYAYAARSGQDSEELKLMIPNYKDAFPTSQCTVGLGNKKEQKAVQKTFQASVARTSEATNAVVVDKGNENCERAVKAVVEAIRTKRYDTAASSFTPEGYEMFQQLIAYGNARLLGQPDLHFYEGADGKVVCRSIPMNFAFKNNHITFAEEVTLTLNAEGKIESLAFAIDNATREEIFNKPSSWSKEVRMAIANFLENYKTAFALKRLGYIRSIFDDYAIIVTGTVTTKSESKGDGGMKLKQNVKYTTFNKTQYMDRLEQQFKKTQFINLRFNDVTMKQISDNDDFALRIKQDYFSSSYSDTGYLFLMVDMNDAARPLIKLRTWQPHRDPDVNPQMPKNSPFYGLLYEGNFE